MQYNRLWRPTVHLYLCILIYFSAIAALDSRGAIDLRGFIAGESLPVVIFCVLIIFYAALWTTYFLSSFGWPLRIQTLRVLLWTESVQTAPGQDDPRTELLREKSKNVITTQAIFIAISVFVISAFLESGVETIEPTSAVWFSVSAHIALGLTTISVVLLIIAADASETTFNQFKSEEHRIISYFYSISAKRKYHGFVFAALAILVFVSRLSPSLASLGLFTFIVAGYPQWFPDLASEKRLQGEQVALAIIMILGCVGIAGHFGAIT